MAMGVRVPYPTTKRSRIKDVWKRLGDMVSISGHGIHVVISAPSNPTVLAARTLGTQTPHSW